VRRDGAPAPLYSVWSRVVTDQPGERNQGWVRDGSMPASFPPGIVKRDWT